MTDVKTPVPGSPSVAASPSGSTSSARSSPFNAWRRKTATRTSLTITTPTASAAVEDNGPKSPSAIKMRSVLGQQTTATDPKSQTILAKVDGMTLRDIMNVLEENERLKAERREKREDDGSSSPSPTPSDWEDTSKQNSEQLSELEDQIEELKSERDALKSDRDALKSERDGLQAKLNASDSEKRVLTQQLSETTAAFMTLETDRDACKKHDKVLEDKLSNALVDLAETKNELHESHFTIKRLETKVEALTKENARLHAQLNGEDLHEEDHWQKDEEEDETDKLTQAQAEKSAEPEVESSKSHCWTLVAVLALAGGAMAHFEHASDVAMTLILSNTGI